MSYEEGYGIKPRDQEGLFDAFDEEEGTPVSPDLGLGSADKAQAESKAFLAKHKKELNDAYSEYLTAAGIKAPVKTATVSTTGTSKAPTVPFTPYTSQEEYEAHLLDPWSPAKAAASADWINKPSYKKVVAPSATARQAKSSGTGYKSSTTTAADQATIVPTTGGGVSYEPSAKKTSTPATTDKIDLDSIAKQIGITTDELKRRLSTPQGAGLYGDDTKVPYRYRHRGYGTIGTDRGYVPNEADLQAMALKAKQMGYEPTYRSRPTLFGGRRVMYKARYNPKTKQVEQHPYSTPDSPGTMDQGVGTYGPDTEQTYKNLNPPAPTVRGIVENQMNPQGQDMRTWLQQNIGNTATPARPENAIPYADPDQESPNVVSPFAYGGNLPYHQAGSQTGVYDWGQAEGYTIPQGATLEGTPNTMGSKGNEKSVWRTKGKGMNPYTADYALAARNIFAGMLESKDTKAYEDKLKKMRTADYTQVASGKDMGDYGPTGQQYGAFRMNQTTPTFDVGYIPGMVGQAPIAKVGGSMSPYSYPSTLPVLPHTGMPSGDMSMYTHWNQRPVMGYGGSSDGPLGYFNKGGMPCMNCGGYMQDGGEYEQDGVYDLSQEEINQIMANGGQIEFID